MSQAFDVSESCVVYEGVMSRVKDESCWFHGDFIVGGSLRRDAPIQVLHTWMSHVSHGDESCLICKWVVCSVWMSHVSCMHMGILLRLCPCGWLIYLGPTCMNGSCLTREWVMSHVCRRESCLMYEWVISHIWIIYVPCMNESCRTYEWIMFHVCMSHASCITYLIRHSLTYSTRHNPAVTTHILHSNSHTRSPPIYLLTNSLTYSIGDTLMVLTHLLHFYSHTWQEAHSWTWSGHISHPHEHTSFSLTNLIRTHILD